MPTIPAEVFEGTLPSRSGLPRTVQDTPLIPSQPGNLGASQTLGNAIEGLGTSALQATALAQQRAAIESRKKDADDVIAGNLGYQQIVMPLQSSMSTELANDDYTTLKDRIEAQGRQIIAAGGEGLSPRARQIYQAKADELLNTFHLRAVNTEIQRRDEAAAFVRQQGRAQAEEGMRNATSRYEYIVHRSHLEDLTQQMVDKGLVRGAPAWDDVQKTIDSVAVQQAQRANRVDPRGMVTHLQALAAGERGNPALPTPPLGQVAALLDDAWQQVDARTQRTEHAERSAAWRSQRTEKQVEQTFNEQLSQLPATPQSLPELQRLLDLANSDEQQRALGPDAHERVVFRLRSRLDQAAQAQAVGEQAQREGARDQVEMDFRVQIRLARTPQQLEDLERTLLARGVTLDPGKFGELDRLLKDRFNEASPSQRPKYREAVHYIERAALVPGITGPMLPDETKQKLLDALDAFDFRYRKALTDEGMGEADRQALDFAQEARLTYFPPETQKLPPALQEAKDHIELGKALKDLEAQGVPWQTRKAYLDAWQRGRATEIELLQKREADKLKPKK